MFYFDTHTRKHVPELFKTYVERQKLVEIYILQN